MNSMRKFRIGPRSRKVPRSLARRLSRSTRRRTIRRIAKGHCPGSTHLNNALRAFARSLRARRQLIKLAPRLYDPAVVRREQRRRERDAERDAEIDAAIEKVYGPGSREETQRIRAQQRAWSEPRLHPATERAVERWWTERTTWFQIGVELLAAYEAHAHHRFPSLQQIARLHELASQLGRASCGIPLDGTAERDEIEPPEERPTFKERLEKIYGHDSSPS